MIHRRSLTLLFTAAAVPLIALAAAACGSSGHGSAGASPTLPTTTTAPPATVGVASSGLGQILVDSQGRTLYLFQKDSGTTSACTGTCAAAWPPLRATGQPTASGANAALLGTTPRSDGGPQVTYNGHPIYVFVKDLQPAETNGEGVNAFGASWFALTPAGNPISPQAPPATPPATTPPPTTPPPTTAPATTPPATTPPPPPVTTPPPTAPPVTNNGIPRGNGGDHDGDNNGGPNDGDGNI